MLDLWNYISLAIFDSLLGWLLHLPSDVVLMSLALLTGGLMVLTRPLATNQDLLTRLDNDRRRINELIRQAKKSKDYQALTRYRATNNRLALRKLAAEGKPLLVVIVPVALLATWAMFRVEFHPPAEDEEFEVAAFVQTTTSAGEVMHLVPEKGLEATNGWIQIIVEKPNEPTWWNRFLVWVRLATPATPAPDRLATWLIKGKAQQDPYVLKFPFRDVTIERQLLIGQTTYAEAVVAREKEPIATQIKMRPVELFGVVPGLGELLPGWLVGYVIIVVPLVFVLKWALHIY